jgi:hypothetical protein
MRNKRATWLVLLSVRCVAERVTYPGMRSFPRLADEQKSCAIRRAYFASSPKATLLGLLRGQNNF